jgi:hypothetical protein
MSDIMVQGATVIRDTLLTIPEILPLTLDAVTGQYKVFWEDVPDGTDFPYIYISYGLGDYDTKSLAAGQASEVTWKVVGVTPNLDTARLFSAAISKFVDPKVPVPLVINDPLVGCNGRPISAGLIFDRWSIQGHSFFEVGRFVRLYLAHLEA